VAGAQYFRVPERVRARKEAIEFVRVLMNAPIYHIAIENPVGMISRYIRLPDQMIHPWQFGDTEEKKTHLWLKNLPLLRPTKFVPFRHHTRWLDKVDSGPKRGHIRSVTFPGIAEAMADQWGTL